jgi:hypothetical protein
MLFLPLQLWLSTGDFVEPSYGSLLLAGLLLLERQRRFGAGLVWGIAYLFAPAAWLAAAAFAVLEGIRRRAGALLVALGFVAAVLPYTVYLHRTTGRWLLQHAEVLLDRAPHAQQGAPLLTRVAEMVATLARGLVGEVGVPLAACALLCGIVFGGRWLALALPVVAIPVSSVDFGGRDWAPYLPVVFTAAWLVLPLAEESVAFVHRRWARALAAVMLVVSVVVTAPPAARALRAESASFPGPRAAGLWLRARVERGDIVVARQPYTSFWAGCRFARVPDGVAASRVVAWARETGADWLEVDVHTALMLAPELLPLLEEVPEHLRGQLTLEQTFRIAGRPEQTTYLYRIAGADASLHRQQEGLRR